MKRGAGQRALDPKKELPSYFGQFIGEKKSVKILDLGAGAFSLMGYCWPGVEVELRLVDFHALLYTDLLKQKGIVPPVLVEYQDMERLTFEDGSFDIVHCSNALDHTEKPWRAISEAVRVCRPGGWVCLRHKQNEASFQQNTGMHRWDVDYIETLKDCAFKNEHDTSPFFFLSECVAGFTTTFEFDKRGRKIIVSLLQKQ